MTDADWRSVGGPGEEPRLVSVNVGMPRDVEWQGKTVHTGIWKSPVHGPRRVRRLNIDGDGQGDLAGHGGENRAVYVYQVDSYRHWAEQLARDDFVYGQFGENFTVTGLADDEVCIGDRYRVGASLLEVTQPRVTCYRVGMRMAEPRMPALLTGSGRPGFYLRVLEEGDVAAGQPIVKVDEGPERMTVAECNALLYRTPHPRPALQRALRIPALSPGWQASFRALLEDPSGGNPGLVANASPPPAWSGFRTARVVERRRESATVWTFLLELAPTDLEPPPAGGPGPDAGLALPGQFVTFRLQPAPGGRAVLRSYSLSAPPDDGRLQVSVKREPRGVGSRYLVDGVRIGDTLDVAAPRGGFVMRAGDGPVVLVSAGVGATPLLAMLHALAAERSAREVWWLHGARNRAEHAFAERVAQLLADLPHSRRHVRYSRPERGDRLGADYDSTGRLAADTLAELGVPRVADHYLCGPPSFRDELVAGLAAGGVPPERIRVEVFGTAASQEPGVVAASRPPPHPPAGPPASGPAVSFSRSDISTRFDPDYGSLLELAEACDVPVRWSCRTGVCHSCETDLLSGSVAYSPEPIDPPPAGRALICCSQPVSDVILDL